MNRWSLTIAPLALLLSQAACTQAPPPAPPDTRAADEKAIKDVEGQWLKDIQAKDVEKSISHYTDDASFLLPDLPIQTGKDAIRATYKQMMADPNLAVDFASTKVEASKSGDFGYSQGTYTMTTTDAKTKKPMTEKGKYVTFFKKQADGSWQAVQDILNADGPATPAK
jgi:uncharacterized protein (TIGR02246 family)